MLETRVDAAGIALQAETESFLARLQLQLLAAAAFFIAIWGGIVLLAIVLPPHLRVPVLGGVVGGSSSARWRPCCDERKCFARSGLHALVPRQP